MCVCVFVCVCARVCVRVCAGLFQISERSAMISSQNKHPATILCLGPCVHSKKSLHNVFGLMKNVIKYKTVMQTMLTETPRCLGGCESFDALMSILARNKYLK